MVPGESLQFIEEPPLTDAVEPRRAPPGRVQGSPEAEVIVVDPSGGRPALIVASRTAER
ncbi:MAG: hypothetical protein ACK46L_02380 [Synechococcaceae cyanobacterium]